MWCEIVALCSQDYSSGVQAGQWISNPQHRLQIEQTSIAKAFLHKSTINKIVANMFRNELKHLSDCAVHCRSKLRNALMHPVLYIFKVINISLLRILSHYCNYNNTHQLNPCVYWYSRRLTLDKVPPMFGNVQYLARFQCYFKSLCSLQYNTTSGWKCVTS